MMTSTQNTELTALTAQVGDRLVSRSPGCDREFPQTVIAADETRIAFAQDTLRPGQQTSSYLRLQWYKRTSPKVRAYTHSDGSTRVWEAGE
jgi:hypothetical protein